MNQLSIIVMLTLMISMGLIACGAGANKAFHSSQAPNLPTLRPIVRHHYELPTPTQPSQSIQKTAFWQRPISAHFQNITFLEALQGLTQGHPFNYAISHKAQTKVSYFATNTPLADALIDLAQQANLMPIWQQNHVHFGLHTPQWRTHRVPHLNLQRQSKSAISLPQGGDSNGDQKTLIENTVKHHFWQTLTENLNRILGDESSHKLVINHEYGIVKVYAPYTLQQAVGRYLQSIIDIYQRQVLIEFSILEVALSEGFQKGIDWSITAGRNTLSQQSLGAQISTVPFSQLTAQGIGQPFDVNIGIRWVEQFGKTQVLSSPRMQVLNGQTALLKVVNNVVYFTIGSQTSINQNTSIANFDTELNRVAVGLSLSLTPHIQKNGRILLNLKPSLSRISGSTTDPHPALAAQGIQSNIPIIQERAFESVLSVQSGETAVIGGLLQQQNEQSNVQNAFGWLGGFQSKLTQNTELVMFITPTVLP